MLALLVLAALATEPVRTVLVAPDTESAVKILCPVGTSVRVRFPEPKLRLHYPESAAITVYGERAHPYAEVRIEAKEPGETALLTFRGTHSNITVTLESTLPATPDGPPELTIEIRLQDPASAEPQPVATPSPQPLDASALAPALDVAVTLQPLAVSTSPPPIPAASGGSQDLTATGLVDIEDLVGAKPERLDRRITIAGHPELRAETLQLGARWTWAQLRLRGGANRTVAVLTWRRGKQTGPVAHWRAEPDGKDLRLTLQLPRGEGRLSVMVQILGGARYDVSLTRPGIGELKDRIF